MKRFIFALITLMFLQQARAQVQQMGFPPAYLPMQTQQFAPINSVASICPQPMLPAQGAYAPQDQADRRQNYGKELKSRVKQEQKRLNKIDKRMEELQEKIDGRFQAEFSTLIVEHIQQKGNPQDLHRDCRAATAASTGSTASNLPVGEGSVTAADKNATAQADTATLPADYRCNGPIAAAWAKNILPGGRVNTAACRETSQLVVRPGSSAYASSCVGALSQYMELAGKRRAAEADLAEARSRLDDYEFGDGDDDIEAETCTTGNCGQRGNGARTSSDGNQWMNLLTTGIAVGLPAFLNWQNQKAQRQSMERMYRYGVDTCAQLGYPPNHPGCQMGSRFPPYLGHQALPYPSQMPGYFGGFNGNYGAVPGAMGQGAFGCSPGGFNQFGFPTTQFGGAPGILPYQQGSYFNGAPGIVPYLGGQGPWGGTPFLQNGQFNTGMPPVVLPYQANAPGYNQYLLNNQVGVMNSQLGIGGPPPVLPMYGNNQALSAPVMAPYTGVGTGYFNTMPGTNVTNGVMYGR